MNTKYVLCLLIMLVSTSMFAQETQFCQVDQSGYAKLLKLKSSSTTVTPHNGKYLRANGDFKTLVVFISYQTDPTTVPGWTQGSAPDNLNTILSSSPSSIPANQESLSHYFNVVSGSEYNTGGGAFKIYGDAVHVTLPYSSTAHGYTTDIRNGLIAADALVDYSDYDNRKNDINDLSDGSDGKVDKIIVVLRGKILGSALGWNVLTYSGAELVLDGVALNTSGAGGSGISSAWTSSFDQYSLLSIIIHEFGHHLISLTHPHANGYVDDAYRKWGILNQGNEKKDGFSINAFDSWILGWSNPTFVTSDQTIELDDFLTSGESVFFQLPGKDYEFFGIENRQKINMFDDATANSTDKGLFITHYNVEDYYKSVSFTGYTPSIRVYPSDGRFDWDYYQDVPSHWNPSQYIPAFEKTSSNPIGGRDLFSMFYKPSNASWNHLYAIKQSDGTVTGADYFKGDDLVSTFDVNERQFFSSITNPAPSDWSGTSSDFAVKVTGSSGNKISFKLHTSYDPYTITENTTWDGQIYLEQNVTVQSGAKLTIDPNTEVYVSDGKSINVYGELETDGAEFTARNNNWGGITYHSGSDGFIKNSTIEKVHGYGGAAIQVNTNNSFEISGNTIQDLTGIKSGINLSNADNINIYDNRIENVTNYGIYSYNSNPKIFDNFIKDFTNSGIYATGYSSAVLSAVSGSNYVGENTISGGKYGLQIGNQSYLNAGSSSSFASQNRIMMQSGSGWAHVYSTSSYSNTARYNFHKHYNSSSTSPVTGGSGSISVYPWLYTDPDPGAGGYKVVQPDIVSSDDQVLLDQAILHRYEGNFAEAETILNELISTSTEENVVSQSLFEYSWLTQLSKDDTYLSKLEELEPVLENSSLEPISKIALAKVFYSRKEHRKALKFLDKIIDMYPNTEERQSALILASYVATDGGLVDQAERYFELATRQNLKAVSPHGELAELRHYMESSLSELDLDSGLNGNEGIEQPEHIVLSNYPNPFNPVTNITYTLAERSQVSLRVFDLLGREVALLVNEIKSSGEYSVSFDASTLSSGIYIYELKTNNEIITKRMTLVK